MFDRANLRPVPHPDRLTSYLKQEWAVLACVAVTGVLCNGGMSLAAVLQGKLLDTVIYSAGLPAVLRQAVIFCAAVLVIQGTRAAKRYGVRLLANRTAASMRRMLYHSVMRRDLAALSAEHEGDLLNKVVGDVDLCVEGLRKVITEIFDTGVLMGGYLIAMLAADWRITLPACVCIPLAMWIAERLKGVIVRWGREARAQSSAVAQQTYSDLEHMLLYRVDGVLPLRQRAYDDALAALEQKSVRANVLENSMQPVYNAISLLGVWAVLVLGGRKVLASGWTVGDFTAYLTMFAALALKASKAAKLFNSFQKAAVSWQRIQPYFTPYQPDDTADAPDPDASGLICRDLCYRSPDAQTDLLHNVSFSARPGEIIGVTGPVACGKSTLGLMLAGAANYEGQAVLNGHALGTLTPFARSRRVSYLGHTPQLLSDTIAHNITLGDAGDLTQVLEDVCFSEDLAAMPDGADTLVGNGGVRLSGGQQARIALARTLWRKTPLVILDDPFSAVDMETERRILANLRTHYADRIFVILSHRLAAFPTLDRIVYLENGHAHCGTHDALFAHCPGYRTLYTLQTEANA